MSQSMGFEVQLKSSPAEAVERVTEALKKEGFGILTRIDVHKALKEKIGVDFRYYAILGACNPTLAHRALSANAEMGLLLPCNVTVEATEEGSLIRIIDPDKMMLVAELGNNKEIIAVATEATTRLKRVAEALAG